MKARHCRLTPPPLAPPCPYPLIEGQATSPFLHLLPPPSSSLPQQRVEYQSLSVIWTSSLTTSSRLWLCFFSSRWLRGRSPKPISTSTAIMVSWVVPSTGGWETDTQVTPMSSKTKTDWCLRLRGTLELNRQWGCALSGDAHLRGGSRSISSSALVQINNQLSACLVLDTSCFHFLPCKAICYWLAQVANHVLTCVGPGCPVKRALQADAATERAPFTSPPVMPGCLHTR